ncbi:hypothetical protein AYY17_10885 [Morganella psychrotolerans]|uniref:Uncharacterized protein n=1 Tax=Morganella psychrotolerans TaxID=368603 RepID=A0A1B8H315_9GAMM|nr:hypothetical protein AYY17_10885 [Morganella psychrotolerans]
MSKESRKFIFFGLFYPITKKKENVCVLPLFIQTAGSLTAGILNDVGYIQEENPGIYPYRNCH